MKILLSKTRALMKVTAEILTENVIKKTFLRKSFVDIICSGLDIDYFARMKKKRLPDTLALIMGFHNTLPSILLANRGNLGNSFYSRNICTVYPSYLFGEM